MSTCMLYFVCTCMLVVCIDDARSICNYYTRTVCSSEGVLLNCSRFYYSVHRTCTRRAPYISGCAKSGDVTTNFFFFFYINTECNVFIVMTHKKTCSSYLPNLFQTAKCLGRDVAQLVRASDRHAADAGSIPRCGKGFSSYS